nr:potassium transporter TrkG [Murinocardiopsis flavida]
MLPVSHAAGERTEFMDALFTAVSAVCVTGLVIVDTPTHWSVFGQWVILGLIQVGGLGIMTLATVMTLLVTRRINLRLQLTAGSETKSVTLGDVRRVVLGVLGFSLVFEGLTALVLTGRYLAGYDYALGRALYYGLFHAVSAFNNAGFALYSDSLMGFAGDPWIIVPLSLALIAGGLGFPVWIEIWRRRRVRRNARWTLHAKITIAVTAVLLVFGPVMVTALEWGNPETLGPMSVGDKLLAGFFQGVVPRTAGFNSLDYAEVNTQTLLTTDLLMFIGGGSAGTAGGIKVTTFALLAFVIFANVRGERSVTVGDRRLAGGVEQQALTVALLAVGLVFCSTFVLTVITPFTLDQLLFEVISAFATVGLSTGITADIPVGGQLLLCFLMFIGRVGPITLAAALALRTRTRRIEFPEARPIVG